MDYRKGKKMTLNVETVLAVSIMLSVFAAIAALGTSMVLGVGFERLRAGFEAITKQAGFFGDMLTRLEKKVEVVDGQTAQTAKTVRHLELKVDGITDQANIFAGTIRQLAEKVDSAGSRPAVEQVPEPANPLANVQYYFSAEREKELKQKNAIRARMYAIAKEIDVPSPQQEPVRDLAQWANAEAPARIHYN